MRYLRLIALTSTIAVLASIAPPGVDLALADDSAERELTAGSDLPDGSDPPVDRILAVPPDLVGATAGDVRIRIRRGSADGTHKIELAVDRAANGPGWDETHDLGTLAGTVSDIETNVHIDKGDRLDVKVSISFHGFSATISYDNDRVARSGEPYPRVIEPSVDGAGRRLCGAGADAVDITSLYSSSNLLMSLSCWEDFTDWDYNDFSMAVDTSPGTETNECVCRVTRNRVPESAIQKALDAPDRVAGWNELLNPNVPGSPPFPEPGYDNPPNPRRTCLDLWNRRRPWHPHFNSVIWRAMCTS